MNRFRCTNCGHISNKDKLVEVKIVRGERETPLTVCPGCYYVNSSLSFCCEHEGCFNFSSEFALDEELGKISVCKEHKIFHQTRGANG